MNPAAKTVVATIQQAGRRLSSSYAKNSIGRVSEIIGSVSTSSQESKRQSTSTPFSQLTDHLVVKPVVQRRKKSSIAVEFDDSDANASYDQSIREPFPSIVLGPEKSVEPQGSFAEAQAQVRFTWKHRVFKFCHAQFVTVPLKFLHTHFCRV